MCCLQAGTAPGKVGPVLEQNQCQGEPKGSEKFFHPKGSFQVFQKGCEKRRTLSHIPAWSHFLQTRWTPNPSREFPLGFQSCEAPEKLEVMVMGTGTADS